MNIFVLQICFILPCLLCFMFYCKIFCLLALYFCLFFSISFFKLCFYGSVMNIYYNLHPYEGRGARTLVGCLSGNLAGRWLLPFRELANRLMQGRLRGSICRLQQGLRYRLNAEQGREYGWGWQYASASGSDSASLRFLGLK